ncbi:MAG TPA: PAS domain S-box protein, partial [Bacteroidales bacterium]|nr:PAS domain S-box protein [Bacteroidales bacterium]
PEDHHLSETMNNRLHRGEFNTVGYEKRYLKSDGSPLWVHVTISAVRDSSGKHINSIGTIEDISGRKEAEEKVRESEERLRLAVESANLGTWDLDLVNDVATRSLRHDQIWGYSEPQKEWGLEIAMRYVAEDDRQLIMEAYERGMKSGLLSHENRVIWPDGSLHWIRVYGQFYYNADKKPVRVMGIVEDITERKEAEIGLTQSEARFRAVFRITTEGIIIFNSKGEAVYVNDAEANLNGFSSPEEMMRSLDYFGKFFEITELDGRFVAYDKWPVAKALRGESVRNWEVRVRRNDINKEWFFNFNAEPVFDEDNNLLQAVLFTRDVTDRRKAEEALHRSRQELKSITDNSPDIIARFDRDLRHTFINPYGEKVYGKTRAEIIGKTNAGLGMPQDKVDFWNKHFNEVFESGKIQNVEFEFESPAFGLQYFFSVFVPEKNEKCEIVSILAITRDISNRKAAEEAIRESEEMLSNMVQAIPVGMALTNFSDRTIYKVNPAWLDITGYSGEEEVLGMTTEQLGIIRDSIVQQQYLDEFRKNGRIRNFETSIFTKNGIQRTASLSLDSISIRGQRYIMASVEDITDQKTLELELKQKNEELTQFIYTVSHDLKSPLVTIKSFTNYLLEDVELGDEEAQSRDIGYIVNAADKMGKLLDELLELSRIGKKEEPKSETELKAIIQSAVDLVAGRISQRGVKVSITGPDIIAYGYQQRLMQLYQNLIDNAVKFMGHQQDPLIEIGSYLDKKKNQVVLFVRDNG